MRANLQGMLLPASFVFWESKMCPQSVKSHSLMPYVNVCTRQFNHVEGTPSIMTPTMSQDVLHLVDDRLATTMHMMRSTISMVLKASQGSLVFFRDMLLNIPLIADW